MDVGVDECVLRPLVHSQIIFDNAEAGDDATARADVDDLFVLLPDFVRELVGPCESSDHHLRARWGAQREDG